MPPLVPQHHPDGRRGAIYQGGLPGNAGGGRTPTSIRAELMGNYADRLPRLRDIADGTTVLTITERCPKCGFEPPASRVEAKDVTVTPEVSLKAMDHMAKIGMGVAKGMDIEEAREKLKRTLDIIDRVLAATPELARRLLAELRPVWDG